MRIRNRKFHLSATLSTVGGKDQLDVDTAIYLSRLMDKTIAEANAHLIKSGYTEATGKASNPQLERVPLNPGKPRTDTSEDWSSMLEDL